MSASSIPATVPTAAAAAASAIKGHSHHDQPILPRFDTPLKCAFLLMVGLTVLGSFNLVPVYIHMMLITLATIYIGSRFALKCWKIETGSSEAVLDENGKEIHKPIGEQMQTKDAMMFPVIGSCVLFSLYLVYKFLPKEWVNFVIKMYFFIFGCLVLAQKLAQIMSGTLPIPLVHSLLAKEFSVPNPSYLGVKIETTLMPILSKIPFLGYNEQPAVTSVSTSTNGGEQQQQSAAAPVDKMMPLSMLDLLALGIGIVISIIYVSTGSWACSNAFGVAFSIQGIEMLSLGSYLNGCILLSGLFIYDIFWVFGTDVMVTVAKSFDAPIKLLFPQFGSGSPSMLGLGDIVIPGIFIALLLRYDIWRNIQAIRQRNTQTKKKTLTKFEEHDLECLYCHIEKQRGLNQFYFQTNLIAYFIGLSITVGVMYYFKAAQPALLYLVPACLGSSLVLSMMKGDFKTLWKYTENEDEAATSTNAAAVSKKVDAPNEVVATSSDETQTESNVISNNAGQSLKKKRSVRAD